MKRLTLFVPLPGLLLAGMLVTPFALAQQPDESRGVARLSLMNGDVSVQRADSGDWVAGALNAPLLAEDRIATGPTSRAEVQFDYFHRVRIAPDSEVRLAELESRRYMLQVARGTVTFTALPGGDAQVEISTPGAAVRPVDHGNYRVTVLPDGTAEITVRSGEAEIFTPRGSQRLRPGRTMLVRPDPNGGPEFTLVSAIERDGWDQFNEARDRELRRGADVYQRYVSRDIYGAEDLNGHGNWIHVPPYGYVWRPYVAAGWAPYQAGRWAWLDWYGWSWVSYDPWGWAPYHYGRWFMHAGNWCWFPGAFHGRHFWSPGLVGWIGFGGPNWGVGLGFGRVGWVPLAPFEPFHPWWGPGFYRGFRGGNFVQNNVTIVNNTNVTNIYRNARIGNAVTVLNGDDFRNGFHGRAARANADDLRRAHLVRGAVPISPERGSLRFSDRDANVPSATRAANGQERFFASRQVGRVERVPFDEQRRAFTGGVREPQLAQGGERGRAAAGDRGGAAFRGTEGEAATSGWRRFGEPRATGGPAAGRDESGRSAGTPAQGFRGASEGGVRSTVGQSRSEEAPGGAEPRSGWRRFGDPNQGARIETPRPEEPGRGLTTGRTSGRSETPDARSSEPARGWSTGGTRERAPAAEPGRPNDSGRGWSTGGTRERTPAAEPGRSNDSGRGWSTGGTRERTPAAEPGRSNESGRGWSTGGTRERAPAAEPGRSNESGRGASTGGGRERSVTSEPSPRSSSEGRNWSTGGSRESSFASSPRSSGGWSTGGGRAEPRNEVQSGGGGNWSAGRSRESSSMSGARGSGGWTTGGGRSEARSQAPSGGGFSRSEGFGRGGGGSISSGPSRSAPSFGGGGSMRSAPSGGFGGGGMRSAPSGGFGGGGGSVRGGSSGGGGGRVSGGAGRSGRQ